MFSLDPSVALQPGDDFGEGTLGHHLSSRLIRLMRALGQDAMIPQALTVGRILSRGWGELRATAWPAWPSDITDDHTPFEFSLALNGTSEAVRILTEPQDALNPSLVSSWRMAEATHEELATQWGTSFRNLASVADLFAPSPSTSARFCVWHSGILGDGRDPQFKIYLNPAIHGSDCATQVLLGALSRLGLDQLWTEFASKAFCRGGLDAPIYFSLDLLDTQEARVKIYVAHHAATSRDVGRVLAGSPGFDVRSVKSWCRELLGGPGPFESRPPITCFALRRGAIEFHSTTLHLPVRCYLSEDFEIARRASRFLNFPQRVRYMRSITALSDRPLESGSGLQTYVSLRASPGKQAVTVYLAPQVYSASASHGVDKFGIFGEGERLRDQRSQARPATVHRSKLLVPS